MVGEQKCWLVEQVSQEIFRRILLSLARSTTRVQKSHLFSLVCKWVPFFPWRGGPCPGESCSCADAEFGRCVQSPSQHGRRWGAAFSQTKQSSSTSALWDHAEMEATWNPSNPIVHLRMWGQKMFFWWQKVVARQKVSKVLSPCLGDLETDVRQGSVTRQTHSGFRG